jgi:hypothetical protein
MTTMTEDHSGTSELAHPTWCTACEVHTTDGDLFGCHSTPPVRIDADDQVSVIRVSVTQFIGNFGEVAEPAVRMESSPGPVVWINAENADKVAGAMTEAAVTLRAVLEKGDYLAVSPSAQD